MIKRPKRIATSQLGRDHRLDDLKNGLSFLGQNRFQQGLGRSSSFLKALFLKEVHIMKVWQGRFYISLASSEGPPPPLLGIWSASFHT